jgi:hypothetical protein
VIRVRKVQTATMDLRVTLVLRARRVLVEKMVLKDYREQQVLKEYRV